jgi:glyoxylase-like metal-dependent hydrolase (beta-lactamase superfamily II)
MLTIHKLVFGPFQENTFVIAAPNKECIIVDPGCYNREENLELQQLITDNGYTPKMLFNTHFHIDHVFGNQFVKDAWGLLPTGHKLGEFTLSHNERAASLYGLHYIPSPPIAHFIEEGDTIAIGAEKLDILFVPGHATGHVALVSKSQKFTISGDVLFQGSIGRTDLPGGDFEVLAESIQTKMYTLPDDYVVYCGHGPETTIGHEKANNPFVRPL